MKHHTANGKGSLTAIFKSIVKIVSPNLHILKLVLLNS